MTYKEKLMKEHPELVDDNYMGGCKYCPGEYFKDAPKIFESCAKMGEDICRKCWNSEIPGTEPTPANKPPERISETLIVSVDYVDGDLYTVTVGQLQNLQVRYKSAFYGEQAKDIYNKLMNK